MADCIFCKLASGEIPTNKLYDDDLVCAFNDTNPQAPIHFLVVPKQHIESCADINESNSAVIARVFEVISKLTKEMGVEYYRIINNCGEKAGQTVKHLHFHVLSGVEME